MSIGGDDIYTIKIRISISDPHTQQLIERMIEDNKGIIDHSFNHKLLVLSAKEFLGIIVQIYGTGNEDGYNNTLKAIKAEAKELHNDLTKDNIISYMGSFKRYLMTSTSRKPLNDFFSPLLFRALLT